MSGEFSALFAQKPLRMEASIPFFGREQDGDCFDETDEAEWRGSRLLESWTSRGLLDNPAIRPVLDRIAAAEDYVIDLAAGPGLGLIPSVRQLRPDMRCMAVDANASVLLAWREFFDQQWIQRIDLAQCSLMALPFRNQAVQAYSSMIGMSSTRAGEAGYAAALAEVYRTLAPGGRLYTVEAEWIDVPAILSLFEKMGQQPWDIFRQTHSTWHERFQAEGFNILYEQAAEHLSLSADDNELGAAAAQYGVPVGLRRTAYILQK